MKYVPRYALSYRNIFLVPDWEHSGTCKHLSSSLEISFVRTESHVTVIPAVMPFSVHISGFSSNSTFCIIVAVGIYLSVFVVNCQFQL